MQENLVIVESPAKAKTIEKFLGKDYLVRSSYGHIRDLPKKGLSIDIEQGFKPVYEISADKKKVVGDLASLVSKAKTVWLASDEDREGEAIAWHLKEVLNLPDDSTRRIVFHEITKNAILEAIEHPRRIDYNLVDAQQARRVLDRIVGFELSPVLWKKLRPSLSAGRVQSVAVRLIVEREMEITDFESKGYFRVTGEFMPQQGDTVIRAELNRRFDTEAEVLDFLNATEQSVYSVASTERKPAAKSPSPPFTTSTLQQEAGRRLSMSVSQTMSAAQKLYENGLITYMRTDSVNLSGQAIAAAKREIVGLFGENYSQVRNYKTKTKGAQEAHEAIRPSYFDKREIEGTPPEKRLYELIWKRATASQMAAAEIEKTTINITVDTRKEYYVAEGEVVKFDGFLRLYSEPVEDDDEQESAGLLPDVAVGSQLGKQRIVAQESFTQAPPRYNEAALVRRLEELGIGRPSTYAPTISTIITRGYVIKQNRVGTQRRYVVLTSDAEGKVSRKEEGRVVGKEKSKLFPTDIGIIVNDYLMGHFDSVIDYNFTASVEKDFDEIAEGKIEWSKMIGDFYARFHPTVESALGTVNMKSDVARVLGIDPATGKEVSARIGRYGPMIRIEPANEGEKARFASLRKGQLVATITLEEALELFSLPRTLGQIDGSDVVVGIGKFGPYVRHNGKFASLAKNDDPYTITLESAAELIAQSAAKSAREPVKVFAEEPELQVLVGRYGPYIAYKGKNYKIPRKIRPEEITLEQCREIAK